MSYDTIVVGVNEAELAADYYLGRAGISFTLIDAGDEIGACWARRWESLRLFPRSAK